MSPRIRVGIVSFILVLLVAFPVARRMLNRPPAADLSPFARELDLSPLANVAVQTDGRLKSFGSFANEMVGFVSGPHEVLGQPDKFTFLDLMIRPERYSSAEIIYVKQTTMRAQIVRALEGTQGFGDAAAARFLKSGLIAESFLFVPRVTTLFESWSRDLIRTAKHVDRIESALQVKRPEVLADQMRVIPPPRGDDKTPWLNINDLFGGSSGSRAQLAAALDPTIKQQLREHWTTMVRAWRTEQATEASRSLAAFCAVLPSIRPDLYPAQSRLGWESWYFRWGHMTWVWLVYLVSVIALLMFVAYKWTKARRIGATVFLVAFGLHTFALGLRWYVSGRWPNSNMFEAVTTAVWFGAALAIVLELVARRTQLRGLFLLTAACASMFAMMAAHFIPELDPNINNRMPILHDIWLYIHTNVIIASYALIAMAAVTGTLYLLHRLGGGAADYARAGGAAVLIEGKTRTELAGRESGKATRGEVFDGATMILMELSFVLLWAGLIMGAIWADHSWGRPWGWDPKEVFALNTFLVFLILVHIRLKVRDKGLWTAILAVAGCGVMLFNWIVINFVISGLHSYA